MPASPFLYLVDDRLSATELSAARLDGHVVEVGDAFIPADAVETPGLRAGSLSATLGDTLAATHLTAAWVHGGLDEPPARHTVQRAVSRRLHHVFGPRLLYRDGCVDERDLQLRGGVRVTTPERTLADLCRTPDTDHADAARRLSRAHPGLADAAIAWYATSGPVPYKRSALALLRRLAAEGNAGEGTVLATSPIVRTT